MVVEVEVATMEVALDIKMEVEVEAHLLLDRVLQT